MITWYVHRRASSEKSKANKLQLNWIYCNPNFTDCFITSKTVTTVFITVQSSTSWVRVTIADIYTTVLKILGKASVIAVPWNGGWTGWKIIFDKNCFPGLMMRNSSGIGRHRCWASFSFPCSEVALPEDPFCQWNHWERVTSSDVVPSKAARWRTQLPGQTCVPLWTWYASSRNYGPRALWQM